MTEETWQAEWIWGPEETSENGIDTRHFYFRRSFDGLESDLSAATMRVCADTRYRLWINGRMLGHGPARGHTANPYFDVYDVREYIKPGVNTLAVLATYYGIGTCYSCLGQPGFLLQADLMYVDGASEVVRTDGTWKAFPAPYATGIERMSIQLAYPEVFDARREPESWNLPGFDDTKWAPARVIGPVGTAPWDRLLPRDIALPYFRGMAPVSVQQTLRVRATGSELETAEKTPAEAMHLATTLEAVLPGAVAFRHPALLTIAPQSGVDGVSVVLDFGKEVSGFPLLVVRKGGGGRIDIGYSERLEADGVVNPDHWGGCDVHYADRLIMRPGFQRYQPLDHRAFRYMRLDFYECPEPVEILVEMTLSGSR